MKTTKRAGRVLSSKNEAKLREALQALADVLAQLAEEDDGRGLRYGVPGVEERCVAMGGVEIREENGQSIIFGHAAVFNRLSVPLFGFQEQIKRGAFARSLARVQDGTHDIRALWQHDTARVLGRTGNGTLRLWEDDQGLAFEIRPPDTADGRDSVTLIGRGDVDKMSFGFNTPFNGDTWSEDENKLPLRTLVDVDLIEISPVTFPAYPDTGVGVAMRNAPDWVQRALTQGGSHNDDEAEAGPRARPDDLLRRINLIGLGL